jgi:hypothetical protein
MQVLSVGGAAFGDLLGREQQRDPAFDSDIGRRALAGLFAARPDFGDDRRQGRRFEHQPMRAQGHRNDGLDLARQPLPARPALLRQQRADTAIARVPLQQVVDLSRRQIQFRRRPGDREAARSSAVEHLTEFARIPLGLQPVVVANGRRGGRCAQGFAQQGLQRPLPIETLSVKSCLNTRLTPRQHDSSPQAPRS